NFPVLNREVYDAAVSTSDPGTLVRSEGQGPSGLADADSVYVFFGDIFDFYWTHHHRNSVDDAGLTLSGTVRYCDTDPNTGQPRCPPRGLAFWSEDKQRMYFGAGIIADDVTGHEVTHGVTASESGLKYENASGAINESFSDIWGEFIDLTNGRGNDTT